MTRPLQTENASSEQRMHAPTPGPAMMPSSTTTSQANDSARIVPAATTSCSGSVSLNASQNQGGIRCGGATNVPMLVGGVFCVLAGLFVTALIIMHLRRRALRRGNRVGDSTQHQEGTSGTGSSEQPAHAAPPISVQADDESDWSNKGGQSPLFTDTVCVRLPTGTPGLLIAWPEQTQKLTGEGFTLPGAALKNQREGNESATSGQQHQGSALTGAKEEEQGSPWVPSPDSTVHSETNFAPSVQGNGGSVMHREGSEGGVPAESQQ